jgi:hypothetical protein
MEDSIWAVTCTCCILLLCTTWSVVGCVWPQHTKKAFACDVIVSHAEVGNNLNLISIYYMSVML